MNLFKVGSFQLISIVIFALLPTGMTCDMKTVDGIIKCPGNQAMTITPDGRLFLIFNENGKVYKFKRNEEGELILKYSYPKLIIQEFTDGPKNADTAFSFKGKMYIMKGNQMWEYKNEMRKNIFKVSKIFPGAPDDGICAAYVDIQGNVVLLKFNKRFEYGFPGPVRDGAKLIKIRKVQKAIDTPKAAFKYFDGNEYINKDGKYFELRPNNKNIRKILDEPPAVPPNN